MEAFIADPSANVILRHQRVEPRVIMAGGNVGILTHGDVDGVCSAALARSIYPKARVDFAEPYQLVEKLRGLSGWDMTVILDLGMNVTQGVEAKEAFKEASESCDIIYVDHHHFPPGITEGTLACKRVVHDKGASTSELAWRFFSPSASLDFVALLGGIGDYQDNTPLMKKLSEKYTQRLSCLEELLLEYALEANRGNDIFRRKTVEALARGLWPSSVPNLMSGVRAALDWDRVIREHVQTKARRIGPRMAFVDNVPFGFTSKGASHAVELSDVEIGVGANRIGRNVRLSLRRAERSKANLNILLKECTLRAGGAGGGHPAAAGAIVPTKKFDEFLKKLEELVGEFFK